MSQASQSCEVSFKTHKRLNADFQALPCNPKDKTLIV